MNIIEAVLKEIDRVNELIATYESIGAAGWFAAVMHKQSVARAKVAIAGGDPIELLKVHKDLKECE